ncbi:hypothetical protein PMIN04_009893 [Paraphaeosphaeria minitans]
MSLTTAITSIVGALPSFFAALRGPDPTDFDFDDASLPAQVQSRDPRATNATHRHRVSTLELELLYFQKRNVALHAREQATQRDIAETLALADKLATPRPGYSLVPEGFVDAAVREAVSQCKARYAAVPREKDARYATEAQAWLEKFATQHTQVSALKNGTRVKIWEVQGAAERSVSEVARLRRELAKKCEEEHRVPIEKMVGERYVAFSREMDGAVRARKRLEGEVERLKQDLEGEQFLHRIAINVTQRLQADLVGERDNYDLLQNDFLRSREALVWSEDAYSRLSKAYTAKVSEIHRLQEENLRTSKQEIQEYEVLTAAHLQTLEALQEGKAKAVETQTMVEEMGDQLATVKAEMNASEVQHNRLRQREAFLEKTLLDLKADRDAMLEKLVVVSEQRKEALEGQRRALKMVDKLKNGELLDDGKEVGAFGEDEEVVSEAQDESLHGDEEVEVFEAIGLGRTGPEKNNEDDGEELDEETVIGSEDEEDDGYDIRGEDERQVGAEYDDVSEGDASDGERW